MNLTGKQKAAILLMSVDSETSAEILKSLRERELTLVSKEMAQLQNIDPETSHDVFVEFSAMARSLGGLLPEERVPLREILEKALGPQRAEELIGLIGAEDDGTAPFQALQ